MPGLTSPDIWGGGEINKCAHCVFQPDTNHDHQATLPSHIVQSTLQMQWNLQPVVVLLWQPARNQADMRPGLFVILHWMIKVEWRKSVILNTWTTKWGISFHIHTYLKGLTRDTDLDYFWGCDEFAASYDLGAVGEVQLRGQGGFVMFDSIHQVHNFMQTCKPKRWSLGGCVWTGTDRGCIWMICTSWVMTFYANQRKTDCWRQCWWSEPRLT